MTTDTDARESFQTLLQAHRGIVAKVAGTYAWHPDDRDDLMQDIAAQLWRAWPNYDPARPFATWMYRIALNVAISDGLPQINADQHQITQVFTNLLMNAYEAMGGRGRVTISAEVIRFKDGGDGRDAVHVEFADNGPGIPPDVADKVFDPFFTTKAQGSGLGLAIVRKIVDAHDGRIDLRTTPGQGTTIRVTLPVTAGNEE